MFTAKDHFGIDLLVQRGGLCGWHQFYFMLGLLVHSPVSEQSSRYTASVWRWIRAVQTTFKDIFVWRGCSAL